ncbi:hypothetical protein ACA910_004210 [Epithemia clementina (nom. ined.)]
MDPPAPEIRFVVTGFGPFQNSLENPTTFIAQTLLSFLEKHQQTDLASRTTTQVLEVSVKYVQTALNELKETILKSPPPPPPPPTTTTTTTAANTRRSVSFCVVLLHLGVNYKGRGFQLEECAYNDATFRAPDVRGYQPVKDVILPELEWGAILSSPLPVHRLCARLQELYDCVGCQPSFQPQQQEQQSESGGIRSEENVETPQQPSIQVYTSQDPGRYVCNYTYCLSLHTFSQNQTATATTTSSSSTANDDTVKFYSLFLHVPPAEIISLEKQSKFVMELMKCLQDELLKMIPNL